MTPLSAPGRAALLDRAAEAVVVISRNGDVLDANAAARALFGACTEGAAARNAFDALHPDDRRLLTEVLADVPPRPVGSAPVEVRVRTRDDEWAVVEVRAADYLDDPSVQGIVVTARDITDRINLREAFRTLGCGNQILVRATDEGSLLDDMCRNIVESGGYLLAWVGFAEHDADKTVSIAASAGRTGYLDGVVVHWGDDPLGRGPTGLTIRTGREHVLDDMRRAPSFSPWLARAEAFGMRTSCTFPLVVRDTVVGAMAIYADRPGAFGPAARSLLRQLTDDLAYGLGRLRDARSLAASEERFRTVAAAAPIGILDIDADTTVTYANPPATAFTGLRSGAQVDDAWVAAVHPDDREVMAAWVDRLASGTLDATVECRVAEPSGSWRHVRLFVAPKGHGGGYILAAADITAEVAALEQLTHQAFYDGLTGLPNRALLLERLAEALATGRDVAVLLLDLDRMKVVNDSVGHDVGDVILQEVGERLRGVALGDDMVARIGGDEFVVMAQDVADAEAASAVAERIVGCLETPIRVDAHLFTVTTSIGVLLAGGYDDAGTVLRDADAAMYQAKSAGRNRWALFDSNAHRQSVERFSLERELRDALRHAEFEVFYQPMVQPATGRPVGAEALVRWRHPRHGLLGPGEFILVAEEAGLIGPIGDWVVEAALGQLRDWDATDCGPRLDRLAINLSARQLDDASTADVVAAALATHRIDPARIALEVTESVVMAEGHEGRRSLDRLKGLGVRMEIDDFGTGYSSLAYLHRLPVDGLKIDRSFVERLGGADDSTRVVRAIVEMSHALGLEVVAEGVSQSRLVAAVADAGCERAQGFHWSEPLPADDFASWWGCHSSQ